MLTSSSRPANILLLERVKNNFTLDRKPRRERSDLEYINVKLDILHIYALHMKLILFDKNAHWTMKPFNFR